MSTEPSRAADADADADASRSDGRRVVEVAEDGDIVLDVTFETSPETLKRSRRALLAGNGRAARHAAPPAPPRPTVRVAYRVRLEALKRHSRYFSNLLSNPRFREARLVADAHSDLAARQVKPALADARDLPFVAVADDDEATQAAEREHVLEDMLRIMHQKPIKAGGRAVDLAYATTLAIMADRFDCVAVVSRALNDHKFKWPVTSARPIFDDLGRATGVEKALRQKVLVSWLLCQPLRLHQATRELIVRGSCRWSSLHDADADTAAAWWNLPEGLEQELGLRRECILNTIASVQRHFLGLYASRDRQCKLGYDSSAACDSFQLGQMLKFLTSKGLLYLVDFSPASLDLVPDTSRVDIEELTATLKQYPSYQVDKHHTNCGPQIRIKPIMDYIRTMLSANAVAISHVDWRRRRAEVSWARAEEQQGGGDDGGRRTFAFTRAIANDERLRYEGVLYADRMARALFTAQSWDWSPEA